MDSFYAIFKKNTYMYIFYAGIEKYIIGDHLYSNTHITHLIVFYKNVGGQR